jgi:hypothetical protein
MAGQYADVWGARPMEIIHSVTSAESIKRKLLSNRLTLLANDPSACNGDRMLKIRPDK